MDTHSQEPVIRGYDPDSMQVQEIQLAAPSSANFSPHYEGVLREMRRHRTGVRTPPTAGATLTTTSDAAGTISSLSDGGPSKNIGAPRYSPRMDADEYVVIVGTKEERVLPILLGLDKLRLTDRTINVQAYLKATDNMGKGVIRLANTFTTDYILENTTSPHNQIIRARRLGSTKVVALTFEHSNLPRCVFFLNEATLVQKYRKLNAICATCGKPGHRTDVCPAPVPENERCALCGKTGVDASQPHECHPRCVLCGGPHVAGSRECPRRYRQPAPSKSANPPAGQTRGRSRTPTRHHNGQRDITSVAGKETRERSTSRSRSGNRVGSPSRSRSRSKGRRSRSQSKGRRSRSRSSGRRPAQQHTRQGQTTSTPPVLKLTGPQVSWASVVASPRTQNSSRNTESPIIAQLQSTIEQQNRTLAQLQQLVAQQQQEISCLRQEIQGNKCPQTTPTAATSADCEMSPASSETPEPDTHITHRRNSLTTPTQASIVDLVDKALEQKLSAFTATITQTIEQSIMKHVSALEERNAKTLHELAMPYITQMQSIIAKHNRQVTQLNEGKHCKGVKLLSGRRDMPAAALSINPDSDDASTTPHDG
ncbi:hypothetical protein HPB49_009763 [Dermacentor silvarum]|uniref:Uncharacterized protein n=1 Tax=Dermacentor silvarum TaxID=543639 RepID=A0ACB8CEH4_DERSI|nr:hypothetical protein HPB49_009763 [Dermacentor silvarum]